VVTLLSGGNHRLAILSTGVFFVIGLLILAKVNVPRGVAAAQAAG
jgi:UMF1 family MFS transporter